MKSRFRYTCSHCFPESPKTQFSVPNSSTLCRATHGFAHSDGFPTVRELEVHDVVVNMPASFPWNVAWGATGEVDVNSAGNTGDVKMDHCPGSCRCRIATGLMAPVHTFLVTAEPAYGYCCCYLLYVVAYIYKWRTPKVWIAQGPAR